MMIMNRIFIILQVGTVLNKQDARDAVRAGAKFLMSPAIVKVPTGLLDLRVSLAFVERSLKYSYFYPPQKFECPWWICVSVKLYLV